MQIGGLCAFFTVLGIGAAASEPTMGDTSNQTAADAAGWLFPVEHVNRALPHWIRFGGEYRLRIESEDGIGFTTTNDVYLLSRFRFNVNIKPTQWLTFFGETQDARIFFNHHVPTDPSFQNSWDVRQAYVQLGSAKEGWVDLIAGRQVLAFGDERVIGPSDYTNTARTFDAVRLDLHHDRTKVSVFASSVVVSRDGVVDHHNQGNNLYGAYGSLEHIVPRATLEPYVLWRVAPANNVLTASRLPGSLNEVTTGVRLAGALPGGFDYDIEMDKQTGALGSRSVDAWAGYWSLGRTFQSVATTPRLFIESQYASGTKNPNDGTWNTFDEIYPSNHDKLGFADLVGRRNIQQIRAGVEETISKRWKLRQAYESFWLATTGDAFYGNTGSISVSANPSATSRHVGQEVDLIAQYKMADGITAGFGYARFFTGRFLKESSRGKDYNYPFIYLDYRF